jgi:DNA topoisomerase-6 subunit B
MLRESKARSLIGFLMMEFTKVGRKTAKDICLKAGIEETRKPRKITDEEVRRLIEVVKNVKLLKPPTDCLSPLGNRMVKEGLRKELNPEWVESITRPPEVYRGWPFQIEVGLAYGGSISEPKIMRFANRVPLLYQQGDCAITKSVAGIDWKRYGLNGKLTPEDPLAIFVHMVSVWVPFTSESKEAIASYPVIIKEIKLALQECARKLGLYLSGKRRHEYHQHRIMTFEKYADETINAISELTEEDRERVSKEFFYLINSRKHKKTEGENGGEEEAEGPGEESDEPGGEEGKPEDRSPRQVTLERLLRREERTDTDRG